ncbi:MAG: hypothetical protein JXR69_09640 [Candidatus Delongbacteria bacterium]|nr:hypothetical protein [Candidatus Delongbacteria bacterium]
MKREYLFILVTIVVAILGLIYKGMFVADKLDETQNIIIENNDRLAKFKRDTLVQSNAKNLVLMRELNKRDNRSYGEVIAELLKTTEDILKESNIKYNVNDINQEQESASNKNWPQMKESFYINVNFTTSYENLMVLMNTIERHKLLVSVSSLSYFRAKPVRDSKEKGPGVHVDEYAIKAPLIVTMRLEYIKFL